MGNLFDLPFEDEPDTARSPEATVDVPLRSKAPAPPPATRSPTPKPPAASAGSPAPRPAAPLIQGRSGTASTPVHATPARPTPGTSATRALTVGQLTAQIRHLLEDAFVEVWVEGELSNCRLWNTGHLYFTLKDSAAQIKGVIFRSALRYLRFKPEDGLKVVARGRISVYDPKGEYQLVCEHLEPQGLGALQLAFEQLKARLQDEGLFEAARKRPLPALPRKIGIVTSTEGAAIRDILKVLARRHATAHIVIRPARVQGEGASVEIARGLKALGHVPGVDVIIVGRGGGSIEDLWAFNEEIVARAITLCPVPVISAVGHETDVTIADFVADLRAPTPSAAAEMVIAAKDEFGTRIGRLTDRLRASAVARLRSLARRLHVVESRPAFSGMPSRVVNRGRHAAELTHALARAGSQAVQRRERSLRALERRLSAGDLRQRFGRVRARLVAVDGRAATALARRLHRATTQLRECAGRLESLSPLAVLGRGYAVCWNEDRTRIIRAARHTAPGDRVHVTLAEGELDCEVRQTANVPGADRAER